MLRSIGLHSVYWKMALAFALAGYLLVFPSQGSFLWGEGGDGGKFNGRGNC